MSSPIDMTDLLLARETLQEAVILLEPEHFEWAVQISRSAIVEAHQWHTYLNGLALCSFVQWLKERAADFPMQPDLSSILQPQYASVLDSVCHLKVGDFTLCLIVAESVANEVVAVPRAIVELPEFVAHFYILLEVQEEQEQAILRGCLRYDQMMQHRQNAKLQADVNWQYPFPLDWFDPDSTHLLFYLRFLNPFAMPLPTASEFQQRQLSMVREELQRLLPQAAGSELQQVLTWEQGAALLTSPPLLNLLYLLQTQPDQTAAITQRLAEVLAQMSQQVINLWHWSQDVLDETAQALLWSMPRSLTLATAMRRSPAKVEAALQDLTQRQGIELPQQARYAYITLEGTAFQLCAVTWLMPPSPPSQPRSNSLQEWALLLILVAQPGRVIPIDTKLQVSTTTVLMEVILETTELYLYGLVEGNQNEAFTATILAPNDLPVTLPAFVCHSERA